MRTRLLGTEIAAPHSVLTRSWERGMTIAEFMSNEMLFAIQLLREDDSARVFAAIKRARGTVSGWDLTRSLSMERKVAIEALLKLKRAGLVNSSGEGLEGYYYLTDVGFRL